MSVSLQDVPHELLLNILEVGALEAPDVSRVMQTCKSLYNSLREYYKQRKFRAICIDNEDLSRPMEIFWALKDVLASLDPAYDPCMSYLFYRAALHSLKAIGCEELIIPIAKAHALSYQSRKKKY